MTVLRRAVLALIVLLGLAATATAKPGLRVAVISDLNGSYGSVRYDPAVDRAIARIIALDPDLVISTGDMVAGQRRPHLSEAELRAMWSAFHAHVTDPLTRAGIPLVVTPGNHDASAYRGFDHERRVYADEWRRHPPEVSILAGGNYPFNYAFDLGEVRFVSMDVTTVGRLDAPQMDWLQTAFDGAGAQRIVFSHLPLRPFAIGRESEVIGDPKLETLLDELSVDLHLSGHHHAFYPGAIGDLGVVSQACLGAGPRALIGQDRKSVRAITLLEISKEGGIVVSASTGPDFSGALRIGNLPQSLGDGASAIKRLDIAAPPGLLWRDRSGYTTP